MDTPETPAFEPLSRSPSLPRPRRPFIGRAREISEVLFISPRTATMHVTNILAKFGVETRAAAVTCAFQHELA